MELDDDEINRVGRVREDVLLVGYHLQPDVISESALDDIRDMDWPPSDPDRAPAQLLAISEAVEAIERASGRNLASVDDRLRSRFANIKARAPEIAEAQARDEAPQMDHGAASVAALAANVRKVGVNKEQFSALTVASVGASNDDDSYDPAIVAHIVNEVMEVWRRHSAHLQRALNEANEDVAAAIAVQRDPDASIGEVRAKMGAVLESRELVTRNVALAEKDGGAAVSEKFDEVTMGVNTPEARIAARKITYGVVNMPELRGYNDNIDRLKYETDQWIERRLQAENRNEQRMEHAPAHAPAPSMISPNSLSM